MFYEHRALSAVPFHHFPQALTIQSFISACCGSLVGSAFLTQVFKYTSRKNFMLLGTNLDGVNPMTSHIPVESLFGSLQHQAMLVSMKEVYGWHCLFGILCLLAFLLKESSLRPLSLHPKFSTIRRTVKHDLKMDTILKED